MLNPVQLPPDPRKGGCKEVPHAGLITLLQTPKKEYVLVHAATGEVQRVPAATSCTLHFAASGFAYVHNDGKCKWAREFFQWSVFEHIASGQRFAWTLNKETLSTQAWWISELQQQWTTNFFPVVRNKDAAPVTCCVYRYRVADAATGVRLYWDMCNLWKAMGVTSDRRTLSRFVRDKFYAVMEKLGCPRSHIFRVEDEAMSKDTVMGDEDQGKDTVMSDDGEGMDITQANSGGDLSGFSTYCMLICLSRKLAMPQPTADGPKEQCKENLVFTRNVLNFILTFCCPDVIEIGIRICKTFVYDAARPLPEGNDVKVRICSGQVDLAALSKHDKFKELPVNVKKSLAISQIQHATLADTLEYLAARPLCFWLFCQIVHAIAVCIENRWPALGVTAKPPLSERVYRRRLDPGSRRALALEHLELARKRRAAPQHPDDDANDAERRLKVSRVAINDFVYRYWLVERRAFADAIRIAFCCDGSRLRGRNTLIGCLMNLVTGVTGWAPPQATTLIKSENFTSHTHARILNQRCFSVCT